MKYQLVRETSPATEPGGWQSGPWHSLSQTQQQHPASHSAHPRLLLPVLLPVVLLLLLLLPVLLPVLLPRYAMQGGAVASEKRKVCDSTGFVRLVRHGWWLGQPTVTGR